MTSSVVSAFSKFDSYEFIPALKEAFIFPVKKWMSLGATPSLNENDCPHLLNAVHGYLRHASVASGQGLREMLVNSIQACEQNGRILLGYRTNDQDLHWSFCLDIKASGITAKDFFESFAAVFNPGNKEAHGDKNRGVGFKASMFNKSQRVVVATRVKNVDRDGLCRVYVLAKGTDGKYYHAEVSKSKYWGGNLVPVEDCFGEMSDKVAVTGGTAIYVLGEDETAGNFVCQNIKPHELAASANSIIWSMPSEIKATAINNGRAGGSLNTKSINGLKSQWQEWQEKQAIQYEEALGIVVTTEWGHEVKINIYYAMVPDSKEWARSHNQTWTPKNQIMFADKFDILKSKDNITALMRSDMSLAIGSDVIIEVINGATQNDTRSQLATDPHIQDTFIDPSQHCFADAVKIYRPQFILNAIYENKQRQLSNVNLGSKVGKLMRMLSQKIKHLNCVQGILNELGQSNANEQFQKGRDKASSPVNSDKKTESERKHRSPATQVKLTPEGMKKANKAKNKGQIMIIIPLGSALPLISWNIDQEVYVYNTTSDLFDDCRARMSSILGSNFNDTLDLNWKNNCITSAYVQAHLDYLEQNCQADQDRAAQLNEIMKPIMKAHYSMEVINAFK